MNHEEAEAAFRAALDAGDVDEILRLTALLDEMDPKRTEPNLLGAALWFGEQGIPVFPLRTMGKVPLPHSRGFKDASTDRDQILRWWEQYPYANIGIATGVKFDVVDIDGPQGQIARASHWDDIFKRIDDDAIAKVLTPRPGGLHIYVPVTGDGNRAGVVPNVDYRGDGGYVVAPPSVREDGQYRFLGTPKLG